ncbi:helix-turn-helix domain-containing protein [Streptomyces sp. NPDC006477]|uniref:helix-turn-helix domain-containing protein n=1 Tax=Streptomyces sp. NPDC006477 TaxID=3364747 RepID=UPI0036784D72
MTTATDDAAIAKRRATVAQLRATGLSLRDIAAKLGTTKDAVYRDTQALARDTATPPDQERRAPVPPEILAVALPAATPATGPATPSRDTATPPATPAVPTLTVPLDPALIADLATLTRNGTSPQAAIRHALAYVASTYRQAWEAGVYPRDANPVIERHSYVPYRPPAPERPTDDETSP